MELPYRCPQTGCSFLSDATCKARKVKAQQVNAGYYTGSQDEMCRECKGPEMSEKSVKQERDRSPRRTEFKNLPEGSEWTGTKCGHAGKKGEDFYVSDYNNCKKCLAAKRPRKSEPVGWCPVEAGEIERKETEAPEESKDMSKPLRLSVREAVESNIIPKTIGGVTSSKTEKQPEVPNIVFEYDCPEHGGYNWYKNGNAIIKTCPECYRIKYAAGMKAMRARQVLISFTHYPWLLKWLQGQGEPVDIILDMLLREIPADEMKALLIESRK